MPGPPSKIMIIRHGEKPPKHNKNGPWDVQLDGQSGNGKSLIVQGWQRAGALNNFFAPYQSTPANSSIESPQYIYAANPTTGSQRPFETVTPLAAWLNYAQNSPQFNTNFSINGGEGAMVQSAMTLDGIVLICWEHDNIMPNIMTAIKDAVPISNWSEIPPKWPDVFYMVWILDLNTNAQSPSYLWSWTNQNLIAGDV